MEMAHRYEYDINLTNIFNKHFFRTSCVDDQLQLHNRRSSTNLASASVDTTGYLRTTSEPPLSVSKICGENQP